MAANQRTPWDTTPHIRAVRICLKVATLMTGKTNQLSIWTSATGPVRFTSALHSAPVHIGSLFLLCPSLTYCTIMPLQCCLNPATHSSNAARQGNSSTSRTNRSMGYVILNRPVGAPPNPKGPASVSSLTNFLAIGQRPLQRSESESGFLQSGMKC
jgi:hypothetical protein